jgi:hypothetical protein
MQMTIRSRLILFVVILLLIGQACSYSIGATPTEQTEQPASMESNLPTPRPAQPILEALVTFQVDIPANTPSGEGIYLVILDEVTGLMLNPQRYLMQAESARHYSLRLPFPLGSVVQYRFARQSTSSIDEYTSDGLPVRYRMYYVAGPGTTQDIVARWRDTTFADKIGYLEGIVTDANNGEPLPGILVAFGGVQTFTAVDGSYFMKNLPLGTQNLVTYSVDGSFHVFQQGAVIAVDVITNAPVQLSKAAQVSLVFVVTLPEDTPPMATVRIAGNLLQLGNTFSDLTVGANTLAERMPVLQKLPDGSYAKNLTLPAGADLRYKYTLGDGFWNAEHNPIGDFVIRQLIVPDTDKLIQDQVSTWRDGQLTPLSFEYTAPASIPASETISIQFYIYDWTQSIPAWSLGGSNWTYILFSPLKLLKDATLNHRFCHQDQCEGSVSTSG